MCMFHAIFEEVQFFMPKIFFFLILIATGCCGSFEIQQRRLDDRSFFKPWYQAFRFANEAGGYTDITSGKVNCDLKDPYVASGHDCVKFEDEVCGQAFAHSTEHPGKLDFALRQSYLNDYTFIFNDCFVEIDLNSALDSLQALEVNGVMYSDVFCTQPVGWKSESSILKFYYSISQGPLRYEFRNGEIWNLVA